MSRNFSVVKKDSVVIDNGSLESSKEYQSLNNLSDEAKSEIYQSTFHELVMNLNVEDLLDYKKHSLILNSICPVMSEKFIQQMPTQVDPLIKSYIDQIENKQEALLLKNLPDKSSQISFIFKDVILNIQKDLKQSGFEHTMRVNEPFYLLLDAIYNQLPLVYPYSLIQIWNPTEV